MSKVQVKLQVDENKPESLLIPFDNVITVDDLINIVLNKEGLERANFLIHSTKVFDKASGTFCDIAVDSPIEHLQKFEIIINKIYHNTPNIQVILNDDTPKYLSLDLTNITSLQVLSRTLLETLKVDADTVMIKKVENFDPDFEEYVNFDSSAVEPTMMFRYFLTSKQTSNISPSVSLSNHSENNTTVCQLVPTETTVSCGFQNAETELCIPKEDVITRQALGRIASLGELYDAHKDTFCGHLLFQSSVDSYVKITDTEKTTVEYVYEDSINAKFKKLEVEAELKASFLCGMIEASGHGKYLSTTSSNGREASASLVCRMTTRHESINISNRLIISELSIDAIQNSPNATHVVTAIQWGACATADLSYKHDDNESKESIEAKLKLALTFIKVKGEGKGIHNDNSHHSFDKFHLKFYVDALPNGEDIPQTVEDATGFMRKLPNLVKNANGGKGVPVAYTMIPLCSFKSYLQEMEFLDKIIHKVDANIIEDIVEVFDEVANSQKTINSIFSDFNEYNYCLREDVIGTVSQKLHELRNMNSALQKDLYSILIDVRSGSKPPTALMDVLNRYRKSSVIPQAITMFSDSLLSYKTKIQYAKCLAKKGVIYVGKDTSVDIKRLHHELKDYYAYFCNWADDNNLADNSKHFIDLADDGLKAMFVDLQVNPHARTIEAIPEGNRICQYFNGRYIDTDVLETAKKDASKCLVKCVEKRQVVEEKPNKRVDVDLRCPQSFKGKFCEPTECEWFCFDCNGRIQYDFKQNFYCHCGYAPVNTFVYRCSHPTHGNEYIGFEEDQLQILIKKIRPNKEINILLLGETGVGKSTWINGFANYLTYSTLGEAEISPPVCLIPSHFVITDSNYQQKFIKVGESKNENFAAGESCTQQPLSHVFTFGKKTIRLIDTPGIGDTRGVSTDNQNFASILNFISNHTELHGICILLKPNNSKMNLVFKYCINSLLAHLHRTAAVNIAFCFTNARSTFYRPGDTFPVLKRYIDELYQSQNIQIDLGKETIYCLDNEAFRFLCLLQHGEIYNDDERKNYDNSWDISVKETHRLLSHFENDVKPHVIGETITLNEARKIILTLAKPLADISKNIQVNIKAIDREKEEISQLDAHEVKLRGKLMITHIGVKSEPLGYPRTVCRSAQCTETKSLSNSNGTQIIYKTICHDHCYLSNVTPEIAPNPELQSCAAIGRDLKCTNCRCGWDLHLHITFKQEEVEEQVEDEHVKNLLKQNKSAKEIQEAAVKSLESKIEQYRKSQSEIDRIVARFAAFLKKNAIVAYNDTVEDYLKLNIQLEKEQSGKIDNSDLIKQMEKQLETYREEKRILDSKLAAGEAVEVKASEIKTLQKELETLPLVGKDIKTLFDATIRGQQANISFGEQYYDPYYASKKYSHATKSRNSVSPSPLSRKKQNYSHGASQQGHQTESKSLLTKTKEFFGFYPDN